MITTRLIPVASRPHAFEMPLQSTALIVVDMQNDFCHPEGFCIGDLGLDGTPVQAIVPTLQVLVDWAREAGVTVVWTKEAHRPDLSDLAPSKKQRYENAGYPVGSSGRRGRFLVSGEWGSQVLAELSPRPDELQLDKPAQSIFPGTDIEAWLRARSITHLLICGVTTQCCVLATYRQASDLGYFCLLIEDCCAAFAPGEHQAAIDVLTSEGGAIGWVASSQQLLHDAAPPLPS
jgi:nicotinamidase-related amidase